MISILVHTLEFALWAVLAVSVASVAFFAFASLFPKKRHAPGTDRSQYRFVVFFPAYHEDSVIRHSVEAFLRQDYPRWLFQLAVISDHMSAATNEWLHQQPIVVHQPVFERSSKAKALQYAVSHTADGFDYAVILDADNMVAPDFLRRLNSLCANGHQAIQCHRTAKNTDNGIAALDGASEEINNTIFRRAHNRIGLSSALIGSGMCFGYEWFRHNVSQLTTAGEDRELEALLLRQRIHIHYADDILVFDEKVSSTDNFQHQRLRWMTAQVQCLLAMLPYLPKAVATGNIDYIDKTLQQALIPRSMLLMLLAVMALFMSVAFPSWCAKWWALLFLLVVSLYIAIPRRLRSHALFSKLLLLPRLVWRMLANVMHINVSNTDFIHTTHNK